jgi:hypothetical protein
LTTTAKGGIIGGIAALLLVALGGAWILFTRRKRKRTSLAELSNEPPSYKDDFGKTYAHISVQGQSELSSEGERCELAAGKQVGELPTEKKTYELPA